MNYFLKIVCALRLHVPRSLVTRLGVCVQNKLNANFKALRTFYYDVLLLTTAYLACAMHFFLGQFSNMELMLLSPLFLIVLLYFRVRSVNITLLFFSFFLSFIDFFIFITSQNTNNHHTSKY